MAKVIRLPTERNERGSRPSVEAGHELAPGIVTVPVWVPPGPSPLELVAGTAAGVGAVLAAPLLQSRILGAMGALVAAPARPSARAPGAHPAATPPAATRPAAAPPAAAPGPDRSSTPDPGWFGPDSVAWKVHGDTAMFVAGMAAFALQTLHPLALAGVADHSSFAQDFMGRTRRTGEFVSGVVYGPSAEAETRVAGVHRIHRRVVGTAPDGRRYDANDPELLEWVHITEYLAITAAYRRFGLHALTRTEMDRYIDEVARVGDAMGVPDPPRSWAALDATFQRQRPRLAVGEQGATAIRFLQDPPGLPAAAKPAWRTVWAGAVTCLPPTARALLGLADPRPVELAACRSLVRALGGLLGPPPPLLAARHRMGLAD
jgi:uncharacterized protein (DUF2236 family)